MNAAGVDPEEFRRVDLYAGHEALVLDYERALTRIDSRTGLRYDVSGHFVWVGERTRQLDGAHVDFAATIHNPVGVKVGPTATPDDVLALVDRLDPDHEPGRLTLITRMGAGRVRDVLPAVVEKVEASGHPVVWICDPMHGNTFESASGVKTRSFDDVVDEVRGLLRGAPRPRHAPRRHPHRAHRRRRHRVRRRCRRPGRGRPRRALRDGVRPAAEPAAVPRAGVPRGGDARSLSPYVPERLRAIGQDGGVEHTLAIDCGGSGIKGSVLDEAGTMRAQRVRIPTPYPIPPSTFLGALHEVALQLPPATRVTVGLPGMIRHGVVVHTPHYVTRRGPRSRPLPDLERAWTGYDAQRRRRTSPSGCRRWSSTTRRSTGPGSWPVPGSS